MTVSNSASHTVLVCLCMVWSLSQRSSIEGEEFCVVKMSYRRGVGTGGTGGLKVHSENVAPINAQPLRGSKRLRTDESTAAPSAKRGAFTSTGLKQVQANQVSATRRTLKEKNSNNVPIYNSENVKKDILKELQHNNEDILELKLNSAAHLDHKVHSSPKKKAEKKNCTNVMVDLSAVCALDYYVEKENLPGNVPDVDRKVVEDTNCQAHYAHDAFTYLREREKLFLVTPYIHQQLEMSPSYRALLVDWMVEVQEIFELNHETLYLAVKIVDRYLSRKQIRKVQIQLLGGSAMLIASKMDERVPPSLDEFVYICDNAYEKSEFIEMERNILSSLDFDLSMPLSYSFLRRYCRSVDMEMREMTLARFILECSLMEYSMVGMRESHVAAAALLLALDVLGKEWNDTLTYYTGYEARELTTARNMLNKLVHHLKGSFKEEKASTRVIIDKYSHEVFHKVAQLDFPPLEQ
ncbi:cyclin B3-like [Tropilaelaps mercedesae]|uniref:Cyclin B3-like n=1 Tax=Tropilaelaps mercedesae TaxID=418985 RepID=A0A1V9XGD7_9ACAR|nr:cyclin B3-like [Tropilaelaps mercedesae]